MQTFLDKFRPADIVALVMITGGITLKFYGYNGTIDSILIGISVFYFGEKLIYDQIKTAKPLEAKAETIEQIIRRIAKSRGVDENLAVRVAKCESGLNPAAINVNTSGSKDRGLYQWNDKYHPEVTDEQAFDAETATKFFCDAVNNGNLSWWNCSKKCWQ